MAANSALESRPMTTTRPYTRREPNATSVRSSPSDVAAPAVITTSVGNADDVGRAAPPVTGRTRRSHAPSNPMPQTSVTSNRVASAGFAPDNVDVNRQRAYTTAATPQNNASARHSHGVKARRADLGDDDNGDTAPNRSRTTRLETFTKPTTGGCANSVNVRHRTMN